MKKWLTKKDETRIIAAYSIRPGDIKPLDAIEHTYVYFPAARAGKAALLKIERETTKTTITGRILVRHSDSEGRIVAVDAWERDDQGLYQWVCRNPAGMPLSDKEVFAAYEKTIAEMKQKYHEFIETMEKQIKPAGRKPHPEKLDERADRIHKLISEGKTDKEIIKELDISRATFYRAKKRKQQ